MSKLKISVAGILAAGLILSIAYAQSAEKLIVMMIGSPQVLINGELSLLDSGDPNAIPEIVEDRAYIPRKFIAENLNMEPKNAKEIEVNGLSYVNLRDVANSNSMSLHYDDGLIVLSTVKDAKAPSDDLLEGYRKRIGDLPVVGSKDKLKELLSVDTMYNGYDGGSVVFREEMGVAVSSAAPPMEAPQAAAGITNDLSGGIAKEAEAARDEADFSSTNVQVQGVDEGDIIKTDGKSIYYASGNKINIVSVSADGKMESASTIQYEPEDYIHEMLLGDNQLIVFAASRNIGVLKERLAPQVEIFDMSYGKAVVKAYIYDMSNIKNPVEKKVVEIDGNFLTARKVRNELYFITTYYSMYDHEKDDFVLPVMTDGTRETAVSYKSMAYFPEAINYRLTNIVGIKLDNLTTQPSIKTYLGGGENIYMSAENLYIATESYTGYRTERAGSYNNTNIYKFALNGGVVTYASRARVDGGILNQFSMDEHNTYFRIATTSRLTTGSTSNNMFVLDRDMNISGSIRNIAPTEQIYSVRFMGDKAYMVTFVLTDPLFAIDLKDPRNPKILGELKIPGFSNYLHPYDENHLIGFGIDAVEQNGSSFNRGMKISMFDVSDMENPKEKFVTIIGDRGTDSELLRNHRALLFDKNKNILAFPISVHMVSPQNQKDVFAYGEMKFQGAYVYSIDMEKGFDLRAQISHTDPTDTYFTDYAAFVKRIIYIGDNLFTVSDKTIKSHSLKDMTEVSSLSYK